MGSEDSDRPTFDRARRGRAHLFAAPRFSGLVAGAGLDAVVALSGVNVTYTGGVYTKGDETPEAVLTSADGRQVLIAAEDYAMGFAEVSWIQDIRPFRHGPDTQERATALLADSIEDLGLSCARVGLEGPLRPEVVDPLTRRLPSLELSDARSVFAEARRVKTVGEIELYRAAMRCTQQAVRSAWAASRPGDTEKTLAARTQSAGLELGADWTSHCQLQSGVHSTVGMAASWEKPIEPGEVVHVDYGGIFCGYRTDFARNAVVRAPTPVQASIYARLAEVQHALISHIEPGMTGGDVWALGVAQFERVGGLVHPWAMIGHGTGLEIHEGIGLDEASSGVLVPGMLVNIEPSHFESGDARYHIEDTLLITETGVELLADAEVTPGSWVARSMQVIA